MTPEQLRQNAAALIAAADGKPWECLLDGGIWAKPQMDIDWYLNMGWQLRPAPEPQMRDWNCPEDVPGPVCWILRAPGGWPCLVTKVADDWLVIGSCHGLRLSWREVADAEYSTTRRKDDWHPCKVIVP